jgi:hypothetical protein
MRFREGRIGRTIAKIPGGERILSFGGSIFGVYYWFKFGKYKELAALPWVLFESRDGLTCRVLANYRRVRHGSPDSAVT